MVRKKTRRRIPPFPLLVGVGVLFSVLFGRFEQLELLGYLVNKDAYTVKTLTVLERTQVTKAISAHHGTTTVTVDGIQGTVAGRDVTVEASVLEGSRWLRVSDSADGRLNAGDKVRVLECPECEFPVDNVEVNVLPLKKYHRASWWTFAFVFFKWNFFTIGAVCYYVLWRRAMMKRSAALAKQRASTAAQK